MRIVVLFIAEPYQCFHGAAIAHALAAHPGVEVTIRYADPGTPAQLHRIRAALAAPPLPVLPLRRSLPTRLLQSVRFLGLCKPFVLWDNRRALRQADAIVTVEDTAWVLRRMGVRTPLIYHPHGAGDGGTGYVARVRAFDLVLPSGPKLAERMLREHLIRPGHYAVTGLVKLETTARLPHTIAPPFPSTCPPSTCPPSTCPIVLYAPHKDPALTSWPACIEPILAAFAAQSTYNLLVAPHVKLFHRRSHRLRQRWEARSTPTIHIDTGSDRSMDGTYTTLADLFVGDVSSMVYEFLARPRPCVFLNPRRIAWQHNPSFAHWHLGDVIEDPAHLLAALHAAPARHALYLERQVAAASASLGIPEGSAHRAATAILGFLAARA